ncbi:MAG: hypothetical protein ACYCVG_09605 [Leptospirillum sp.]
MAISGGANSIVTRNHKDWVGKELRFPQIRIISPEQLLEEIK